MSWTLGQYVASASSLLVICLIGLIFISRTEAPYSLALTYSDDGIHEVLEADKDLAAVIDAELVDDNNSNG